MRSISQPVRNAGRSDGCHREGAFWLLEECRQSSTLELFILIGGDAADDHIFYPRSELVTEQHRYRPCPGFYHYALS